MRDVDDQESSFRTMDMLLREYSHCLLTPYKPDYSKYPCVSSYLRHL